MSEFRRITAVVLAVAALSCGGGANDNELQGTDVDQIAATLAQSFGSTNAAQVATSSSSRRSNALTTSVPINVTTACPAGGHVTTGGTIVATCPNPPATGDCSVYGAVTFQFGDRTNNLNDCTYANGLVVDGTLYLTISGSGSGATLTLTETLNGGVELNRKGPTGGLIPISINGIHTCFVFLTAKVPERTITGTVCGRTVNRSF